MALNDQTSVPGQEWWRHAVTYQIYPRSFADANGDGVGDLAGITSRLPYLRDLGVDAIWISPFYTSPQKDHGYDVADYCDIDPLFGTLADADEMIEQRARARPPGDRRPGAQPHLRPARLVPGRARRRPGQPRARPLPVPRQPPTARPTTGSRSSAARRGPRSRTASGTSTCSTPRQPDLDWRNPEIGDMFVDVLRFWLDRGVDGFRIDVAHGLFKEEGLPDVARTERRPGPGARRRGPMWDQPEVHEVYRRWHDVLAKYDGDRMLVAEAWTVDARVDGPLHPRRRDEPGVQLRLAARAVVGRGVRRRHRRHPRGGRPGRRHPHLGALEPRRDPPPEPVRRRRGRPGPGPGGDARRCWRCRARRTSTRARSSASARSRSSRSSGRTRSGSAPARPAGTAAGCRSRGAATPRRSGSGRARASRGSRSPPSGRR